MILPLVEIIGLDIAPHDSYFHIINRTLDITELTDQIKIWSVSSTIAWAIGISIIMILNLLFGKGGTMIDPLVPIAVLVVIMFWLKSKEKSQLKAAAAS